MLNHNDPNVETLGYSRMSLRDNRTGDAVHVPAHRSFYESPHSEMCPTSSLFRRSGLSALYGPLETRKTAAAPMVGIETEFAEVTVSRDQADWSSVLFR